MKFTIERGALLKTLGHAVGVVEKRNTIPILSNVLISAEAGKIKIRATDLDIDISEGVAADVAQTGEATVGGHFLHDALRRLKSGSQVEIATTDAHGGQVTVKSGSSSYKVGALPPIDFPTMPEPSGGASFDVPADDLRYLLDKTKVSVSTEATRFYLNGVFLSVAAGDDGPALRGVSTDGHRLSRADVTLPEDAANMPAAILPRKTALELRKLLADYEGHVRTHVSDSKIRFEIGEITLTSKLIDGTFPDYQRVIPKPGKFEASVDAEAFGSAIDCVSLVSGNGAIKLDLQDAQLVVSCAHPDAGEAKDEVDAVTEGGAVQIGFNARYLRDMIGQMSGDRFSLNFCDAGSPALIKDAGDPKALYVLMPMRC
jgi:DNA polymerase-3 subunit beta